MKVLILGNQGNIGGQWEALLSTASDIILAGLDREQLDMSDFPALIDRLNLLLPDVVINCVAYNAVDQAETESGYQAARLINGDLVGVLADWALDHQAVLFHYSTDYVFSGDQESGYQESDTPNPINNYGRSKLLGEREIIGRESLGLKYYLIRTSKLFGPPGKSIAAKPSFFDVMKNLAETQTELKVVDGECSCFTYTTDLALASWQLFSLHQPFGLYHLTNTTPATWFEAAQKLFMFLHRPVNITPIASGDLNRLASRPRNSTLINTKTAALRSYEEALQAYLLTKN